MNRTSIHGGGIHYCSGTLVYFCTIHINPPAYSTVLHLCLSAFSQPRANHHHTGTFNSAWGWDKMLHFIYIQLNWRTADALKHAKPQPPGRLMARAYLLYRKYKQAVIYKNGGGSSAKPKGPSILLSKIQRGPKA